ncbi:uncharacterized protein LOC128724329 [Anopheles nili]|uniref:uncharacterized protein LOC128724329 n=1 Tax=Anopheles nili TaxID=185578 RepID=UPI00237AA224|nr:uncharacterized protein LOC128724329 [Anopheles nili]
MQDACNKQNAHEYAQHDLQIQRRTSSRLLTSVRNDGSISSASSSSRSSPTSSSPMVTNSIGNSAKQTFLPPSSNNSIICRLPLNRLESIMGMLNIMKHCPNKTTPTLRSNSTFALLCLYCDRTFSSQKLMIKHTDRIHRIAKERRSSARVLSVAANGTEITSCCSFCNKGKILNLPPDDLPQLFKHLFTEHGDRYYACERCTLRFPNKAAMESHMETLHSVTSAGRPKSKAALKAFSHGSNNGVDQKKEPTPEATNPLTVQVDFGEETERSGDSSRNNSKTESVLQNIRLRSSLRSGSAHEAEVIGEVENQSKTKAFKKSERLLRRNAEPMLLSRLGIAQNRLPRQSRRLLAAASSSANSAATSSDTPSTPSATSATALLSGKFGAKKRTPSVNNTDDVQPLNNCYNKISKLKTIRSTLNNLPMAANAFNDSIDLSSASVRGSGLPMNGDVTAVTTASIIDSSAVHNDMLNNRSSNSNCQSINSNVGCSNTSNLNINGCGGTNINQINSAGVFDDDFYDNVTGNVKKNLSCHLDGKLEASTPNAPSPMSPVAVIPAVRSTVVKSPVTTDSKIHEATNLPAVSVMFPTLLTVEQYGTDTSAAATGATILPASSTSLTTAKVKKPITKNSWKWKWDFVKKYKYVNENGRIVKKIKQPTLGLRDISKLDMWTQLTMRTKHELFQNSRSVVQYQLQYSRAMVEQLDQILDARLMPQIDMEQNEQRIIKIEPLEEQSSEDAPSQIRACNEVNTILSLPGSCSTSSMALCSTYDSSLAKTMGPEFLLGLHLIKSKRQCKKAAVVLSGEWARPRCYICYGCGAKFNSLKQVEEHRIFRHPHVHSTFYEIVGRELIEKKLYKKFFIPFMALAVHRSHYLKLADAERFKPVGFVHANNCTIKTATEIKNEDSSSNEDTSFSTSTSASSFSSRYSSNSIVTPLIENSPDSVNALTRCLVSVVEDEEGDDNLRPVMCSKCQKECQNLVVLYAHILHCSNDYVWLQAKKRMKYRRAKRRRGGNRNGGGCGNALLSVTKKSQRQQNAVEKLETASTTSSSSSRADDCTVSSVQVTPNQSTKNQCMRKPPAAPKKCDPLSIVTQEDAFNATPFKALSPALSSNSTTPCNGTIVSNYSGNGIGSKRKPKKLNDCIAMLTGKLSERLGVDFFNIESDQKAKSHDDMSESSTNLPVEAESSTANSVVSSEIVPPSNEQPQLMSKCPSPTSSPLSSIAPMVNFETPSSTSHSRINSIPVSTWSQEHWAEPKPLSNAQSTPLQLQSNEIPTENVETKECGTEKKLEALVSSNLQVPPSIVDKPLPEAKLFDVCSLPRKSFSFSNDEDESPKDINKLVENIINEADNTSNSSTDYSDDDNMSLACFAARKDGTKNHVTQSSAVLFTKPTLGTEVYNSSRAMSVIADDESTTNTDALDDDSMSVTTEIPVSTTTIEGNRFKRKRRRTMRHSSKPKRQKAKPQDNEMKALQTFNCELCRKVFKKQDTYNKHRMTLSHIAKLSEQEYLILQQKQQEQKSLPMVDGMLQKSDKQTVNKESSDQRKEKTPENEMSPSHAQQMVTSAAKVAFSGVDKSNEQSAQSIKELSQEEKLFYECCSMLKESHSNESDRNHLSVSLKSNETLNAAILSAPRLVVPEDDEDLLNAVPSSCVKSAEYTEKSSVAENEKLDRDKHIEAPKFEACQELTEESDNYLANRYGPSNVGENMAPQTAIKSSSASISCISNVSINNAKIKTKGALKGYDNFKISIPMTGLTVMSASTTSIGVTSGKESRLDTLADVALCGDIPKEFGIAEQCNESNISAVTRIEFTNSSPEEADSFPVHRAELIKDDKTFVSSTTVMRCNGKSGKHELKNNLTAPKIFGDDASSVSPGTKKNIDSGAQVVIKSPQKKPWTKTSYRRKMEKNGHHQSSAATARSIASAPSNLPCLEEGDDVYAFQDSPNDGVLPTTYCSKKNTSNTQNAIRGDEIVPQITKHKSSSIHLSTLEEPEDSQMSSLSFSDRDDFIYGTNTMSEEEEEEEDKNSSNSSEQVTPKKLNNTDVQKKSLIMGRIFKKGGTKDKQSNDAEIRKVVAAIPEVANVVQTTISGTTTTSSKSTTTNKPAVKDFDKLFDTLKNAAASTNELQNSNDSEVLLKTLAGSNKRRCGSSEEGAVVTIDSGIESKLLEYRDQFTQHQHLFDLNDAEKSFIGVGRLRRRTNVCPKKMTETWDSDEYEDFQADGIIKLINETENVEGANDAIKTNSTTPKVSKESANKDLLEKIQEHNVIDQSSSYGTNDNMNEHHNIAENMEKFVGLKKTTLSAVERKPPKMEVVTDDTIRKVMESVILETMGKGSNNHKRKTSIHAVSSAITTTALNCKSIRQSSSNCNNVNNRLLSTMTEDVSHALEVTSLEEHVLESSVVISSKTITSKFKQKLSSSMRYDTEKTHNEDDGKTKPKDKASSLSSIEPQLNISSHTLMNNNNDNNTNNNNNNSDNRNKLIAKASKASNFTKHKLKLKGEEEDNAGKMSSTALSKHRKPAPKKMKNVAYDPDSDYEQSIKCKKVKRKLLEHDIEANLKIEQLQSTLLNADDGSMLLTTSRRKRNAGEMLYYWSSTSDEEFEREDHSSVAAAACSKYLSTSAQIGKKRGRKKKQSNNAELHDAPNVRNNNDVINFEEVQQASPQDSSAFPPSLGAQSPKDSGLLTVEKKGKVNQATIRKKSSITRSKKQLHQTEDGKSVTINVPATVTEDSSSTNNEHLQQHGWIMGDSHKKLVTLLAHAKGKQDSRKTMSNRRK